MAAKDEKAELLERIRNRPAVDLGIETADLIRNGREERDRQHAVREVLAELRALPPDTKLTRDEVLAYLERLPPRPNDFTSADDIRELRGPLPEDDPDYLRKVVSRR